MRRIALLVAVLVLVTVAGSALGGVAEAKKPTGTVAGHYTYNIFGDPCNWRTWTIHAVGTNPVKGSWTVDRWTCGGLTNSLTGSVTCLRVDGDDAWVAGPIAGGGAAFIFLHDGGSPGAAGDRALGWFADPPQTLEDMETICEAMPSPPFLLWSAGPPPGLVQIDAQPVIKGNLTVRDGG